MSTIKRPFQSGSRQAPDPYDKYLDDAGFYRKHVARDATCLFRTISEHMFQTQIYHGFVRETCVEYMSLHKDLFKNAIDKDPDDYLKEMSKPKTYGTLLELRAMAYYYGRNVLLFEAYNIGTWLVHEDEFDDYFSIFYTPEKHFDTIFTRDYVETLAFCQSIYYDILYSKVFKLPDVKYAVERMLHDPIDRGVGSLLIPSDTDPYPERICLDDGRSFLLDRPESTNCILDNYLLCHFHNSNFKSFEKSLQKDSYGNDEKNTPSLNKLVQSLLPEKYKSCVRQILDENITPFPYKVAKALDPDIYRNIEFDTWNERRKQQRIRNWYHGGNDLQVGVKCLVKLRQSQQSLYNCHIQDMDSNGGPCLVFIEELGEKRSVPYAYLNPLPPEKIQPWTLPFRVTKNQMKQNHSMESLRKRRLFKRKACDDVDKHEQYSNEYYADNSSNYSNFYKDPNNNVDGSDSFNYKSSHFFSPNKENIASKLEPYISLRNYEPPRCDVVAMPVYLNNGNIKNSPNNSAFNDTIKHENTSTTTAAPNFFEDADYEVFQPGGNIQYGPVPPQQSIPGPPPHHPPPVFYYPNYEPFYTQYNLSAPGNVTGFIPPNPWPWMNSSSNGNGYSNQFGIGDTANSTSTTWPSLIPSTSGCLNVSTTGSTNSNGGGGGVGSGSGGFTGNNPNGANLSIGNYSMANGGFGWMHADGPAIRRLDLLYSTHPINLQAKPSFSPNGADVPVFDMPTVRFFYNLGHEYSKLLQSKHGMNILMSLTQPNDNPPLNLDHSTNDMSDLTSDFSSMSIDKNSSIQSKNSDHHNRRYQMNKNYKKDNKRHPQSGHNTNSNKKYHQGSSGVGLNNNNNNHKKSESPSLNDSNNTTIDESSFRQWYSYGNYDQHSIYMPYGMCPPSNAFSFGPPSIPPHQQQQQQSSSDGSSIDPIDSSNYAYFYQLHPGQFVCQPPQAQIAIAPHGYWYPPPPISVTSNIQMSPQQQQQTQQPLPPPPPPPAQSSSYHNTPNTTASSPN